MFRSGLVQLFVRNAGLDGDVEIVGTEGENSIHKFEVDANATMDCSESSLETGPSRKGRHGNRSAMADLSNGTDIFCSLRVHNNVETVEVSSRGGRPFCT